MTDAPDLKPLKTWSHLAGQRRRPSEYEIVSTNLLWSTDDELPWSLSPDMDMNQWYLKYRDGSPLKHVDWDAFRDPDGLVYRTYNILQDGQEAYVDGLLDEHNASGHDAELSAGWLDSLALLYTPARYMLHAVQMSSAYLVQMAPASTIVNCAMLQAADQLRWVSRTAYRTKELSLTAPDKGFGDKERALWENDPAWQGFRELMERALVAYDWGEQFVALNLVAKPAIDEAFVRQLGQAAHRAGDGLLRQLLDAQQADSVRARNWSAALVALALQTDGNKQVLADWVAKWAPLGDAASDAFCAALPDAGDAAAQAKDEAEAFRAGLGLGR
ncbi:MAG: toluene monooxygenase [Rhodospirillaceae bacterium]|nr:toluene monooxygenase [Rhodospirillaceae bacterium]MBT5039475.1 toluene monooxygenase [Rhodospirillaceae bacterium]MBT5675744.1 toluene monooxygenase [Rhodospirillaceae bacterium]MBT5780349.1 toluene monooxygenase [Rhodospirillaceae bacterium]MBT6828539.1 toluene monooxygenase [Rhodospirillaceae bacterium]